MTEIYTSKRMFVVFLSSVLTKRNASHVGGSLTATGISSSVLQSGMKLTPTVYTVQTLRTQPTRHFGTSSQKIVLHMRISELLPLCDKCCTVDVCSSVSFFSGKRADPLSPSVVAVACRLFEVNRDSMVRMHLIYTQPLPVEQGMHCALQLLIVITSD